MAIVFLACFLIHYTDSVRVPTSWAYDEIGSDVLDWVDLYPECGYSHQSPIDIISDNDTSNCNQPLLLDWVSQTEHFVIRNNGHSLQAIPFEISHELGSDLSGLEVLHHTNDTNIRLKNSFYHTYKSSVNSEYCFDSLHFHWSIDNKYGTEHTINGQYYPLEVHLIHYSCDYYMSNMAMKAYSNGDASEKYDDDNVLAVIAVIFEIGEANPVLTQILNDVEGVHKYHDPEDVDDNILELYYTEFDMMGLLPLNKEMMGYLGSLTTPPCYETVRWHLMKNRMTVSEKQMEQFRSMLKSTDLNDTMAPNWRPLQDIGDRVIYQCQEMVDEEMVEKDDEAQVESEEEEVTWFSIGIVLFCLFGVAIVVIGWLSYVVHGNNKKMVHKYTKTVYPKP